MSGAAPREHTAGAGRFKPYPAYKDSGVEWLGEIPAGWRSKRLKFVAPIRVSKLKVKPDDALYVGLEHVESWTGRLLLDTQPEAVDSVVGTFRAGDVLFGKLRPYLAKAASPDFDGVCTSEILALRPTSGGSQRYVMYCLLNAPYIRWLDSLTFGTKMPRVSPEQVSSSFAPVPPEPEQRAIAAFLDRETARIDGLVAKKEQLIELLQEKRTALITRVVTKGLPAEAAAKAGLDPDLPMKDSGVEWLGQIPAHWEVKRIRDVAEALQTGPFGSQLHANEYVLGGHPVINPANLRDGGLVPDGECTVNDAAAERLAHHRLQDGDILFARRGELGRCGLVTTQEEGWLCGTGCLRLRVHRDAARPRFLIRLLSTSGVADWLGLQSVGATMQNINTSIIGRIPLVVPPTADQEAIAAFLDRETVRIDALVAKVREATDRFKELRTALISAAVTGKMDVRGEVK